MTADAEDIGVLEGCVHPADGKALRPFNIHFQKIDVADVESATQSIHGSGADRKSMRGAESIQEVIGGIIDSFCSPRRLCYGSLQRNYICEPVVVYESLQATISPRMSFDANDLSLGSDGPCERQGFFPNSGANIHNDVAWARRVAPEEISFGDLIQKLQIQPEVRLPIGEVTRPGLVDPNVAIAKDTVHSFVL